MKTERRNKLESIGFFQDRCVGVEGVGYTTVGNGIAGTIEASADVDIDVLAGANTDDRRISVSSPGYEDVFPHISINTDAVASPSSNDATTDGMAVSSFVSIPIPNHIL